MMMKSLHYVSLEVRSLPYYYGLTDIDKFMDAFEREVLEKHRFEALDLALCLQYFGLRIKKNLMDGANIED